MASFKVSGIDELCNAMAKVQNIPNNIITDMLQAMGEVAKKAIESYARAKGIVGTGLTIASIKIKRPKITPTGGQTAVTFEGSRTRVNTTTRNAEIAFINEFGKRGQPARPFIKEAIDKEGDKIGDAGTEIFNKWLETNGL